MPSTHIMKPIGCRMMPIGPIIKPIPIEAIQETLAWIPFLIFHHAYILTLTMKTSSLLPIANTYNHLCSHVIFHNFSSLNQCRGRGLKYIGGILIEAPQQVKIPWSYGCFRPQYGHCSEAMGISLLHPAHFLRKLFGVPEYFISLVLKIKHGEIVRNRPARRSMIPRFGFENVRTPLKLINKRPHTITANTFIRFLGSFPVFTK